MVDFRVKILSIADVLLYNCGLFTGKSVCVVRRGVLSSLLLSKSPGSGLEFADICRRAGLWGLNPLNAKRSQFLFLFAQGVPVWTLRKRPPALLLWLPSFSSFAETKMFSKGLF